MGDTFRRKPVLVHDAARGNPGEAKGGSMVMSLKYYEKNWVEGRKKLEGMDVGE
jgi:hypothetical protein